MAVRLLYSRSDRQWRMVQECLSEDEAMVLWVDVSGMSVEEHWCCVVRSSGDRCWERLPGSGADGAWTADDLAQPVKFRAAVAAPSSSVAELDALAAQLYSQRLAPASRHFDGVKALYVAGVGLMAAIPVEIQVKDRTVSDIPSGSFLVRFAASQSTSGCETPKAANETPYVRIRGRRTFPAACRAARRASLP